MNIYVGNLSHSTTESDLRAKFEQHGEVSRINIPTDRETNQPRGFGFVEMPKATEAQAAINGLNGTELKGSEIKVNEARPKSDDRSGGGRSGGRSGGGYNRSW